MGIQVGKRVPVESRNSWKLKNKKKTKLWKTLLNQELT